MAIVELKAELAGVIWKVVSVPGQKVAEGDDVVVIESMKMEIPVCAIADGMVIEILVAEGDTVSEGMVLARIEARS